MRLDSSKKLSPNPDIEIEQMNQSQQFNNIIHIISQRFTVGKRQ
jgi:hypothetical protein